MALEDSTPAHPPSSDSSEESSRRRNVRSHQAILRATLDLVDDVGYDRLTIEGIAAKAGVGKSTIYRWWNSKGELVVEALTDVLTARPIQSTGDTRRDLIAIVEQIVDLYSDDTGARTIIAGLIGDMHHNSELAETLRKQFIEPRRDGNRAIVALAIERRDLPADIDIDLVIDQLTAPIAYRALVTGGPITPRLVGELVDQVFDSSRRST